ncbi:Chitin synthase, class 3 [Lithohypha guttulata]|uniref:chitin synthase n=1 Tax=Lithohypha guttulata TaxID=1690604 RepID=A0AAN7YJY1_9EURO|nr:Chitin synthase, class 3 [Lithohypha guttulata]
MPSPPKPRPTTSPTRERAPYRTYTNYSDVETGTYSMHSQDSFVRPPLPPDSPHSRADDRALIMSSKTSDLGRKKSLVRPDRRRLDSNDPNYHYRKHAQNMDVLPSTTGNDPMLEDDEHRTISSEGSGLKPFSDDIIGGRGRTAKAPRASDPISRKKAPKDGKLQRKDTRPVLTDIEKQRLKEQDFAKPPSVWNIYCAIVTFWAPNLLLKCFGMPARAQRRAWREKIGLVSIILLIAAFVGYLTFGFTQTVCARPGLRLAINKVDRGFMIFHGSAYNLANSYHPAADGIALDSNVLYDLPHKYGGQDGSFMFQQVNGECKGLINKAPNSNIPSNSDGSLAWYFPCTAFNQDGSGDADFGYDNTTYLGYACHTTSNARNAFYNLKKSGEVYFTWEDVKNSSRNLMVYGNSVIDLDLVRWLDPAQVTYPSAFDDLRNNNLTRGQDTTHVFQSAEDRQMVRCLEQTMRVGSIDTESVGCIASKVVLYVSLFFILAIVLVKFLLALLFQWFFSRKYAAAKTSQTSDPKQRAKQIEEWTQDIYTPAPKITDPNSTVSGSDGRTSKRASTMLPSTSRFTSPYAHDRRPSRQQLTTMTTQSRPTSMMYKGGYNISSATLDPSGGRMSVAASRSSLMLGDQRLSQMIDDNVVMNSFIHADVVPQPPPDYQPFGYPLCHTMCLVTAYSEGEDGIRTTLDSIATTDYPNSHKVIIVICDGLIKGKGEALSTPDIVLGMMGDFTIVPEDVEAYSYVAVASGSKRHNMAKVYSGFYDYGAKSRIARDKQQRVPMVLITKCGTPEEQGKSKPGNRGKRDSQIILMSFLQKVMFDERMTELEFEMFNGIWKVTGMSPDFYETVLMVDADTKVFPDSLTHMISAMVKDPEVMGLCGETKIANKRASWVSMIQVFEYFISHHLSKSFESVFGGVTCLPGCFCMYRIKSPKGGQNYWVPILANPDVVEHYSENVVDTLHKKNLLLLGEDRFLSTLMLKTFPKRKQVFVPQAVCKTTVPEEFSVLLSQRRRWINSTVHNLMELVLVRDLCGTFCFSMQFVVFIELIGTLVLPAAISFTVYLIIISIVAKPVPIIPLLLLGLILGLPAVLIVLTAHRWSYVLWMMIYLVSLPIWNFVLPVYAYWKFDDFSWGDTRKTAGDTKGGHGIELEGEFDSSKITMKRWGDFEQERRRTGMNSQMSNYRRPSTASLPLINLRGQSVSPAPYVTNRAGYEPYRDEDY